MPAFRVANSGRKVGGGIAGFNDVPWVPIRWYWSCESGLGGLALDPATSFAAPVPPMPIEISRLVLESVSSEKRSVDLCRSCEQNYFL